jgi:hypothetical protein
MQVRVNNQDYQTSAGPDQTLGELAQEVAQADPAVPHLVVNIHCDGQPLPDDQMDQMLAKPIRDFQQLELVTQPLGPLVAGTLAETRDRFAQADAARTQIAELLNQGRWEPAFEQLQGLFNAWRDVQKAVVMAAQALNVSLNDLTTEDRPIDEVFETFKKLLAELKEAMLARDLVLVADLLQYEFEQPFQDWRMLLDQLHERAEALAHA